MPVSAEQQTQTSSVTEAQQDQVTSVSEAWQAQATFVAEDQQSQVSYVAEVPQEQTSSMAVDSGAGYGSVDPKSSRAERLVSFLEMLINAGAQAGASASGVSETYDAGANASTEIAGFDTDTQVEDPSPSRPVSVASVLRSDLADALDREEELQYSAGPTIEPSSAEEMAFAEGAGEDIPFPSVSPAGWEHDLENSSTDPKKVIASYGLPEGEARQLIERHEAAGKMRSPERMIKRYEELARDDPQDYLAAYRAGEVSLSIGRKGRAKVWLEEALSINPRYRPARALLKRVS
ncbi:MAG: hypothetical protein IJR14_11635 [Synergistaceae bacterium]|nr:hypothetical protein [Synergistaceae bacterium]